MPNWCENQTIITGDTATVKKFMNDFCGFDSEYKFANIVPLPQTDESLSDWFQAVEVWGTKWDLNNDYLTVSDDSDLIGSDEDLKRFEFSYLTAWSPPLSFWQKVSEKYPSLRIDSFYIEPGIGYYGQFIAINGSSQDYECSFDDAGIDLWDMTTDDMFLALFPIVEWQ